MKKIALAATLAVAGLFTAMQASAAQPTADFNVNIKTTAGCVITSAPTDVNFSYTAFAAADVNSTGGDFKLKCSNTLAYGFSLDTAGPYTDPTTQLKYSLTLPTATAGTGVEQSYTITGLMAKDQAGTCAAASGTFCDNSAAPPKRTLTITY